MSHSEPKMWPKMTLRETRMGLLGVKFPQVSHSPTIGSGGKPKLAQILCGSPDLGDPEADAPVPPRATPPYPLDTFGGLRTNFSSINPSDRASVMRDLVSPFGSPDANLVRKPDQGKD